METKLENFLQIWWFSSNFKILQSLLYNSRKCVYVYMFNVKSVIFHNPTLDYRRKQNNFCDSN